MLRRFYARKLRMQLILILTWSKTNNLMRILLTFVIVTISLTLPLGCLSQNHLRPGYIVTLSGDTTKGFIVFSDKTYNPKSIGFKTSSEDAGKTYTASGLKSFGVEDKNFEAATISVTDIAPGPEKFGYDKEPRYRTDTTFLETLFDGLKSLYYYNDRDGREHFYIKNESGYTLLLFHQYLKDSLGGTVFVPVKQYISQLSAYLNCGSVKEQLLSLDYKENPMINLFQKYYQLCGGIAVFSRPVKKLMIKTGLLGGISSSSINFKAASGKSFSYLTNADFPSSQNFAGGVFLNVVFPKSDSRWAIENELLYTTYQTSVVHTEMISQDYYTVNDMTIGFNQIRLNNLLRLSFAIGKFAFFIEGGITNPFAISETNINNKETHSLSSVDNVTEKAVSDARKYEQGFLAGAGINFSKLALHARFENSNGTSKVTSLKSQSNKLYLLLAYEL